MRRCAGSLVWNLISGESGGVVTNKWIYPDCRGLRVLQIIPELDIGGAEMTTLEIATALGVAGGDAFVMSAGGRLSEPLQAAGATLINAPMASKNPLTMARNARRIKSVIEEYQISLVHARSRAPAWSALWASRASHVPFVTTYHSKVHASPPLKVVYNSVMARGDRVIANSQYTAQRIRDVHQINEQRLRIIPRGCDLDALNPARYAVAQRRDLRNGLGISGNDFVVLCPARLTKWKGQHVLLEAVARADVPRDQLTVIFAGDAQGRDAYLSELRAFAAEHQIKAHFAGLVRDMPAFYAMSDMIIIPSIEAEPFGRTAIEAQAAGRPVIASDAGGFRETVIAAGPNQTGWLVPPADHLALAQSLSLAFSLTKSQRQTMGRAARRHIQNNFSTQRLCAETLSVYRELVADAPAAAAVSGQSVK
jgi:glycosyltransferase involved in cell wall biosynthesis